MWVSVLLLTLCLGAHFVFLMQPMGFDGSTIICIKNISPSEARDLGKTWKQNSDVWNYLPLLNKVKTRLFKRL